MSDQFVAEIRIFAGNFAPMGWALCNGQLLGISQNTALFSLIGTYYGGNGTSDFQLPNMRGSSPMNFGQGPGLSTRVVGETGGETSVTLTQSQLPVHTHGVLAASSSGQGSPAGHSFGALGRGKPAAYAAGGSLVSLNANSVTVSGGNQPHNNLPPYLVMNFIIALQGIYPSRG
jgi:microcystin-dependent protein